MYDLVHNRTDIALRCDDTSAPQQVYLVDVNHIFAAELTKWTMLYAVCCITRVWNHEHYPRHTGTIKQTRCVFAFQTFNTCSIGTTAGRTDVRCQDFDGMCNKDQDAVLINDEMAVKTSATTESTALKRHYRQLCRWQQSRYVWWWLGTMHSDSVSLKLCTDFAILYNCLAQLLLIRKVMDLELAILAASRSTLLMHSHTIHKSTLLELAFHAPSIQTQRMRLLIGRMPASR